MTKRLWEVYQILSFTVIKFPCITSKVAKGLSLKKILSPPESPVESLY